MALAKVSNLASRPSFHNTKNKTISPYASTLIGATFCKDYEEVGRALLPKNASIASQSVSGGRVYR